MVPDGQKSAQVQSTDNRSAQRTSVLTLGEANALIREQYFGLRTLLARTARDKALAEDILNDALATSIEHLQAGRIANPEQIAGYVYQVAMNLLRNHRRKMDERSDNKVDAESVHDLASSGDASDGVSADSLAAQVRAIIEQLPTERDRLIVKRFYLDEEEKEVICKELSLSALHFDRVIHRARQRMKELMEKRGLKRSDFFLMLCAV